MKITRFTRLELNDARLPEARNICNGNLAPYK